MKPPLPHGQIKTLKATATSCEDDLATLWATIQSFYIPGHAKNQLLDSLHKSQHAAKQAETELENQLRGPP